jgi:uncharacterized protein YegP (UPF0339 family)
MRIEIFKRGLLRRWYFRVRAENGQIVAQSEGYSRRIDCLHTAYSMRDRIKDAEVIDV